MAGSLPRNPTASFHSPDFSSWVSSLFGRELADNEQVTVGVPEPAAEQIVQDRAQARRRLLESMDRLSARFKGLSDEQLEAALDKAMQAVRPSYEPQR